MTQRQANIFKAIKEAFEEVDALQDVFSEEEISAYYSELKAKAYYSELTTIKELATLVALFRKLE
ncbi:MAG: hypothetical protein IJ262_09140 [Clostridia bacterium]|nr:hypothetical protein [Clostridia bacterium]